MTWEFQRIALLIALALLLVTAASSYLSWVETYHARREAARASRVLGLQLRNVITLLFAAGFKMPRRHDWNDDFHRTSFSGEGPDTDWDWKAPE